MKTMDHEGTEETTRRLDHELTLVREAVAMIRAGSATRVTLAGLSMGVVLLPVARRLAEQAGVRIVPLWSLDEAHVDLAVERLARA